MVKEECDDYAPILPLLFLQWWNLVLLEVVIAILTQYDMCFVNNQIKVLENQQEKKYPFDSVLWMESMYSRSGTLYSGKWKYTYQNT